MKINKWIWLLALPWYVVDSSHVYHSASGTTDVIVHSWNIQGEECNTKEYCEDLAAALNEAHERREKNKSQYKHDWGEKKIHRPEQKPIFNYKAACGADDCGKESQ